MEKVSVLSRGDGRGCAGRQESRHNMLHEWTWAYHLWRPEWPNPYAQQKFRHQDVSSFNDNQHRLPVEK
eukprot:01874_3